MQFTALVLAILIKFSLSEVVGPWWNNAVYYRILVESFKDGDGDGLGDLRGAAKQISYVRALGADAVILSHLAARNTDCSKPGLLNYVELDERYGNLETFSDFMEKAKKLELKVVMTFWLKSVSAASEWFTLSADRVAGYEDWILWRNGTADEPKPPEEDVDTWMWHEGRGAYWGASNKEAILNLCSEGLSAALSAAQCAWLRRGIAGVLLNPDFPTDQSCSERLVRKMTTEAMSCARSGNLDTPVILVESSLRQEIAAKYYGDGGMGANSILSSALTSTMRRSAAELAVEFHTAMLHAPQDKLPTWMTSAVNNSRITSRHGTDMVDAINLLTLILPGAAIIQQGDELGAADSILEWVSPTDTCWPRTPTASAAPFPWNDSPNGGFTSGEPWLPLASNYRYANAKTEFGNDQSHVGVVRIAAAMRKSPAIGPHAEIKRLGEAIAILRWGGTGSLLVVCNLHSDQTEAQLSKIPGLPSEMTIATSSGGSSLSIGAHLSLDKPLKLAPGETVLLAGAPRHCGGPGPVYKIANKLSEGWQKINKYFSNL